MSRLISLTGLILLGALAAGCTVAPEESAEDVGEAAQAQIDPGQRYALTQAGSLNAMSWRGSTTSSPDVEYWVSKPAYSPGAARSFAKTSSSCGAFKREVCGGSAWTGATYYRAVVQPATLVCDLPPGPCSPSAGAVSFLGSGTYVTSNAAGQPYASTYVSGACEYWAMQHTISSSSTQAPQVSGYSSLTQFETAMCAQSPIPSTWFTVYYEEVSDFCSSSTTC